MWRLGGGRSAVFVETSIMAHPPSGSVQTECVRMPYDAPPLSCGRICQGASISHQVGGNAERELENISVTVAGPLLQSNDDGMDELEFQTVLHILVHAHIRDAVAVVQGAGAELVYVDLVLNRRRLRNLFYAQESLCPCNVFFCLLGGEACFV